MKIMDYRWLRNPSGHIWSYLSSEDITRGTVVKEGEKEYHAWGISDPWGIFRTLREAKRKVEINVGKKEEE